MVAAALKGRDSMGVEKSELQNSCALHRLETLFHSEGLL